MNTNIYDTTDFPSGMCKDCNLREENRCMGFVQCKQNLIALMELEELIGERQTERSSE